MLKEFVFYNHKLHSIRRNNAKFKKIRDSKWDVKVLKLTHCN